MIAVPDAALWPAAVMIAVLVVMICFRTLTLAHARWWASPFALLAGGCALLLLGPNAALGAALALGALVVHLTPSRASELGGGALAIAAVVISPPMGIAAVASAALCSRRALLAGTAAASIVILLARFPLSMIGLLAAAAIVLHLASTRLPSASALPSVRDMWGFARIGAAVGVLALVFLDDRRGLVAPDAFWGPLLLAIPSALAGVALGLAFTGGRMLLSVRDPARRVLLWSLVTAAVAALFTLREGILLLLVGLALAFGACAARAQRQLLPDIVRMMTSLRPQGPPKRG